MKERQDKSWCFWIDTPFLRLIKKFLLVNDVDLVRSRSYNYGQILMFG